MIQRILCPTDLTADSKDGVTCAFSLARRNSAQLIVFHATSFPSLWQVPCELDSYYEWEQLVSMFKIERMVAEAESKVRGFICENFRVDSDGVAWKPKIGLGRVAEEIVAATFQEDVDLIVMDRRQRGLLARVFTRGILETVSRNAPCPVLSIDATKPTHLYGGWRMPILEEIAHPH
jgi:nucleotide-binding universal stress UspA family protein